MMKSLRVACPAKINLTLEVVNKRDDGFHNIKSIMQLISLYDFLDIKIEKSLSSSDIILAGNSNELLYDETNLVYKAAKIFFDKANIQNYNVSIYIEKNIPISAGLAGGSTDASGAIFGLNEIFEKPLTNQDLHELCAKLGSDLNVCLEGGCLLATGRGEKTKHLPVKTQSVSLIKPKRLGISAKEAYTKYSQKKIKPQNNMTEKMVQALYNGDDINQYLYNDLEYAVFDDYEELQYIKKLYPDAIMSGSGSTFFVLNNIINSDINSDYKIMTGLNFINHGVILV